VRPAPVYAQARLSVVPRNIRDLAMVRSGFGLAIDVNCETTGTI
jgi:hypothetical protein